MSPVLFIKEPFSDFFFMFQLFCKSNIFLKKCLQAATKDWNWAFQVWKTWKRLFSIKGWVVFFIAMMNFRVHFKINNSHRSGNQSVYINIFELKLAKIFDKNFNLHKIIAYTWFNVNFIKCSEKSTCFNMEIGPVLLLIYNFTYIDPFWLFFWLMM